MLRYDKVMGQVEYAVSFKFLPMHIDPGSYRSRKHIKS